MNKFRKLNDVLDKCCQLALRQPLPEKQIFLLIDASFPVTGCALLTEDDTKQNRVNTQNLGLSYTRFQNIYLLTKEILPLGQRIYCNILANHIIWTHFLGITATCYCDRQQIGEIIFPNQNDPNTKMERV